MRRYALRDDQWGRIKDFLPGREGHVEARRRTIGCSSRLLVPISSWYPVA